MVEHALPVFARHLTPLTGRSRLAVTAINEPVSCGGVRVRPGDVVVGEGSGVVCIPAERAVEVAELVIRPRRRGGRRRAAQRAHLEHGDGQVSAPMKSRGRPACAFDLVRGRRRPHPVPRPRRRSRHAHPALFTGAGSSPGVGFPEWASAWS
jgi:Aldolase/RraA